MVFENLCILVLLTKVALALEGLIVPVLLLITFQLKVALCKVGVSFG